MKRIIVLTILCVMITVSAFADNAERIKELTDETTQLQQNLTLYQQTISNIQVRLIQVNAVIAELRNQDLKDKVVK